MQINGFANYLVKNGILNESEALQLQIEAQQNNSSLISYLIKNKLLDYKIIAKYTAKYFGLPLANLHDDDIKNLPLSLIDKKLIEKYQILPISQQDNQLYIAVTDPTQTQVINEIKFHTNFNIKLEIAEYDKLIKIIDNILYTKRYEDFNSEDTHIIKLVDQILNEAIDKGASDIHFEPYQNNYRIRFRIDGILHEITNPDSSLASRLSARLKIISGLNISERRLPQDGRFNFGTRDCRINICPILCGEKIVIRILNPDNLLLQIDDLGFEEQQQKIFLNAIKRPQGMVIVTGPTGSGKTVSLYAALNHLNSIDKNISTVEDPIEIGLHGINQVNINSKIGLSFAAVLRAFLRQDPDIIMVGEIRDLETAEIAVKAAQTGHLVLSTLHTNSAAESIIRLLNIGIPGFNINSSLTLVIAQRLIRKLCPHCKQQQKISPQTLLEQGFTKNEINNLTIYSAHGCKHCNKGYRGRTGIFEFMPISEQIGQAIIKHKNATEIHNQARQQGMITLQESALNKVRLGITSLEEINRVI
jgi:type IV pilus assembly protein PilB